jgi:hypothetical protein
MGELKDKKEEYASVETYQFYIKKMASEINDVKFLRRIYTILKEYLKRVRN